MDNVYFRDSLLTTFHKSEGNTRLTDMCACDMLEKDRDKILRYIEPLQLHRDLP